jgi:flavin reductase (DIM6/NTAB) family NADH-FMN oxidoreductase RutF/DNA-binding IclR family transcriptional regulator
VNTRTSTDPRYFREVLGQYPTGVVAVLGLSSSGEPLGMILGTFNSVSLDPPLISFMPSKTSSSWARLRDVTRYSVNVLGSHQEDVCRALSSKSGDKFAQVAWELNDSGLPFLPSSVAYLECTRTEVVDGGDHDIVLAQVDSLQSGEPNVPLLFFQGGYGSFRPLSMVSFDRDLTAHLRSVDLIRPIMDNLARRFLTEVTAVVRVGNELVLAASSGRSATANFPTRVGTRLPFIPPLGGVFAAWGDEHTRRAWIAQAEDRARAEDAIERIRERGYALGLGHEKSALWERASVSAEDGHEAEANLRRRIADVRADYNPAKVTDGAEDIEFRFAQAPVFDEIGRVELALTMWGPAGVVDLATLQTWTKALREASETGAAAVARADRGAA